MYSSYIQEAAAAMADRMNQSPVPLYGSKLRLPNRQAVILLIKEIRKLMFPAYFGDPELMSLAPADYAALILERVEAQLRAQIALALPESEADRAAEVAREIIERMPYIQEMLLKDLDATFDGDPAAASKEEVIFAYPGLFAIFVYRIAHELYLRKIPMIPRIMTEYAHSHTGIDINPGAKIGSYFFIDHGTGIVVGETTDIGDHVKLYQGVTLGGTGKDQGKRHPTLGDNVLVGAGAKVLGPFRVGDNARVAAGAVVLDAVPDNATAVGVPARIVRVGGKRVMDNSTLDQIHVADPVAQEMCRMRLEIECLHGELNSCRREKSKLTAQKAEKNKEE